MEPKPVMTSLASWLKRNALESDRISMVWGDVGMSNFIFRDGSIVGLTGREQAHLGDPMKDWASALSRGIDNLPAEDELFSVYEEFSGIPMMKTASAITRPSSTHNASAHRIPSSGASRRHPISISPSFGWGSAFPSPAWTRASKSPDAERSHR